MTKHVQVLKRIDLDGHSVLPGLYRMVDHFYIKCKVAFPDSIFNFNRTMIYAEIQDWINLGAELRPAVTKEMMVQRKQDLIVELNAN